MKKWATTELGRSSLIVLAVTLFGCEGLDAPHEPERAPVHTADAALERSDEALAVSQALPRCGNGVLNGAELCDGDTVACVDLATSYSGGSATCRADCRGYDVSTCARQPARVEYVKPALRDARWSDAMCSKAGEFFFTVLLTGSDRWHISLEGGGYCSPGDINPCYARPDTLTTDLENIGNVTFSPADGERVRARGSIEHPASFADANVVTLHYCSNDLWSGTRTSPLALPAGPQGSATMPFRFNGRVNVAAAIDTLQQRYGLDDANPNTAVFFFGSSAGGHGVLNNADQLARRLPKTTRGGRLHGLAVAAQLPSTWGTVSASVPGNWSLKEGGQHTGLFVEDVVEDLVTGWQSRYSPTCEAAHPSEPWQCAFAATHHPYLTDRAPAGLGLPIALAQNLTDPFYQNMHGIVSPQAGGFAPGGALASQAWAALHAQELASLRWVYAPRHELGQHGIPLNRPPVDPNVPTLGALMDAFVLGGRRPADFHLVDFGRLQPKP